MPLGRCVEERVRPNHLVVRGACCAHPASDEGCASSGIEHDGTLERVGAARALHIEMPAARCGKSYVSHRRSAQHLGTCLFCPLRKARLELAPIDVPTASIGIEEMLGLVQLF